MNGNQSPDKRGTVEEVWDEAHEWHEIIEGRAIKDDLTGALFRRGLQKVLQKMIKEPGKYLDRYGDSLTGQRVGIMILDLDHFKQVNDTYGHGVGDRVLQKFSGLLISSVRDTDAVLRPGGEEFALFLFGGGENGEETYRQIDERLKQLPIGTGEGRETIKVNFSAGLTVVDWSQMEKIARTPEEKLADVINDICQPADEALYRAKQQGRGRLMISQQ